jgi:ABC-type transport system involved in multi-copper enzyme maturation permease subunit
MRRPASVLGPLYWQERDRIGRRPSFHVLLAAVPLLLLGLLALLHPEGVLMPRQQAEVAERVFWSVVFAQFVLVWLVTPAFAAAVLTEEREKQTLDLLLTTTLTNRELVAGKLFARLTVVGASVLAGLPVVAVLQVYGGFTLWQVAVAYLALFVNLFGVGGAAAGVAAHCPSQRVAFYTSIPFVLVLSIVPLFGPWVGLAMAVKGQPVEPQMYVLFLAGNLTVGSLGLFLAMQAVGPMRTAAVAKRPPPPRARVVAVDTVRPKFIQETTRVVAPTRKQGVRTTIDWNYPAGPCPGPSPTLVTGLVFAAAVLVGLAAGLTFFDARVYDAVNARRGNDGGFSAGLSLWLVPAAIAAAVSTAGLVTREREADTLIMLVTVPAERAEILWRKLVKAVIPAAGLAILTASTVCFFLLLCPDRGWALVYAGEAVMATAAAAVLGVLVTVTMRSTVTAQLAAVLIGLAVPAVPPFLAFALDATDRQAVVVYLAGLAGLTPLAWAAAVRRFDRVGDQRG